MKILGLVFLGLVLAVGFWAHSYGLNFDAWLAGRGFSILEVLQANNNQTGFLRDYPGGSRVTTLASPTFYVYLLGDRLGIAWMSMVYTMILLEMCVLLFGAWLLWWSLVPGDKNVSKEQRQIFNLMFVWIAALLLISTVQRTNLANFGYPNFHGRFYGFADGLRLAAIAMILRQRWINAAIFFLLCFVVHPIKAVIVAGFSAPIVLRDWRDLINVRFLLAVVVAGAGVLLWSTLLLGIMTGDQGVPLDDFVAYTRTLQHHWYPVESGLFGDRHLRGITPFLALFLVTLLALSQNGWDASTSSKLKLGLVAAVVLVVVGLYISVDPPSATLVRLCLIRASNLISLIAPIIIVAGTYFAWQDRDWLSVSGYLAFLGTAFSTDLETTRLSAVFALLLVAATFHKTKRIEPVSLIAALAVAISIVFYAFTETGWEEILAGALPAVLIFGSIFGLLHLLERATPPALAARAAACVLTVLAIVGGLNFSQKKTDRFYMRADELRAYKETQLWANRQTPDTALFMVDPCRWYGWRDISGRASLGTIREWYMTAWIYTDSAVNLEKGKQIAQTLGFDMEPFRDRPRARKKLCDVARGVYYDRSMAGQSRIAEKFDVDFFVFENQYATDFLSELQDRADFHNEYFTVVSAERLN